MQSLETHVLALAWIGENQGGRTAEGNFLIGENVVEGGEGVRQACGVEVSERAVKKGSVSLDILDGQGQGG